MSNVTNEELRKQLSLHSMRFTFRGVTYEYDPLTERWWELRRVPGQVKRRRFDIPGVPVKLAPQLSRAFKELFKERV